MYRGFLMVLVILLMTGCGSIQRLPAGATEESQHSLAIVEPLAATVTATSTPVAKLFMPYVLNPFNPSPTPTSTPRPGGKEPVTGGHTFPPYSTSYYITSVDGTFMYNLGCDIGADTLSTLGVQDILVLLDYGYPKYVDGYYGASLMGYGPVSVDEIAFATQQFAWGYYNCTGIDFDSHMRIGIGTNNYPGSKNPSVSFEHGEAWAEMVNEVNDWIVARGLSAQVDAVGANDIELSWNSYVETKDWLDGYDSVNAYDLYNFGAIPGCPSLDRIGAQCGTYPHVWSYEQVWYVIYGAGPVYPLPEIYLTNGVNAEQWYLMSVYSVEKHGTPVGFIGSLTSYQACQQKGGCRGTGWGIDNTPQQGWTQLYRLLNGNPYTAQGLRWASDMKWTSPPRPAMLSVDEGGGQILGDTVTPASVLYQNAVANLEAALEAPDLSDTAKLGLQEKLAAAALAESRRAQGAANPALKGEAAMLSADAPAVPLRLETVEEILEGSEGLVQPVLAAIQNLWRGSVDGVSVQALAGAQAENPAQGVLILFWNDAGQIEVHSQMYLAPDGAGSLRIVQRQGNELQLQTASGATLYFDLINRSFR